MARSSLTRVLRRLGFQFLRGGDPGDQGHVHEQAVVAAYFVAHLADGFEERQRFDVADGAADFGDHDVHVARPTFLHGGLDLVGDVRDHLHGLAQIIAAALARDDLFVDASAGEVVGLREAGMGEAFVVAQVEIGLGAVVGDEDFAVLERAHGAGIDVEVRIELLAGDLQAAAFQQAADAGGGDSLPERGNHAAGYEYKFSHALSPHSMDASNKPDTRSRSSGVSTPSDSYSVSTTRMRKPFSRARSCSSVRIVPEDPPAARNKPAGNRADRRRGRCV